MKALLAIIGSAITGGVILLRWWLSPERIKKRVFKNDEKERRKFVTKLRLGDVNGAYDMFDCRVRENRSRRRR